MSRKLRETFIPGSDADCEDIFKYPYTIEEETIEYLRNHGRIMFIIRGPAGTGKESLAEMLSSRDRYPDAVICCADHYFKNTFSSGKRDHRSLSESHAYCKKRAETSCRNGANPIVIKNTHVKKIEMQNYLNLAAEYNYTVIIASTVHKFTISPEILAKSNTKGLDVEYFTKRLKQWQELLPVLVGWFISPDDSSYLFNELKTSLEYLLGDGKFCRILNIFDDEKILEFYKVKRLLYCIAACSEKNYFSDLRSYYNQDDVKDHYGQCFTLVVKGFIVSPVSVLAIVHLNQAMSKLHYGKPFFTSCSKSDSVNDELDMQSLHISPAFNRGNFALYNKACTFSGKPKHTLRKTAILENWKEEETIDVKSCSCIHLAQNKAEASTIPWHLKMFFHKMLFAVSNSNGIISMDNFGELQDGYMYCRLPGNAWILRPPHKIVLKSVFTGMYT